MKRKRNVIARYYDKKGRVLELVEEKQKRLVDRKKQEETEIKLYQGKDYIPPWELHARNLDLSRSSESEIVLLIAVYIQSSSDMRSCLQKMIFPHGAVMEIWSSMYKENTLIKEAILQYQNVLPHQDFMNNLNLKEKWIVFTQNNHRTIENMTPFVTMYQDVISDFLQTYLSSENIQSNELLYGEWRRLIQETTTEFYSDTVRTNALKEAICKTESEYKVKEQELFLIEKEIKEVDKAYELATISEKLKMQSDMKGLIQHEDDKRNELREIEEKKGRIEVYFTQTYLPLLD